MKWFSSSFIVPVLFLLTGSDVLAEGTAEWNQFRGPRGSGVSPDGRPPVRIGADNLAWKTPVSGGLSSPVLYRNRLFLTAVDEDDGFVTLAFDSETGDLLWSRNAPEAPPEKVHEVNSRATPTPFVDENRVYVYFGAYGLLCYDHSGELLWTREIPTPKSLYGSATSPVGYRGSLILVLDNDANLPDSKLSRSRILALDKSTGDVLWETPRPFFRSGWSTPTIWDHGSGRDLVVLGSGRVSGYNPDTGAEKWFATGFSRETIAIPVVGKGLIYAMAAQLGGVPDEKIDPEPFWKAVLQFDVNKDQRIERGEMTGHFTFPLRPELPPGHPGYGIPLPKDEKERGKRLDSILGWIDRDNDGFWTESEFVANISRGRGKPRLMAIRPGGKGDITESHVAWQLHRNIPEIPSPLFHDGRIYLVRNGGILAGVNAKNGGVLYRERLGGSGQYSASPVAAGGYLYLVSNRGLVSVVREGDAFELVHEHNLGEAGKVSPAIDALTIYFRTSGHLLAFRRD